jgi:hypothetical protein
MKRRFPALLILGMLAGCAPLRALGLHTEERTALWIDAHRFLSAAEFAEAETAFAELAREYPRTVEGRESLFYLGALRLDPRNDDWDSDLAEVRLAEYLDLARDGGPRLYRYPEARTLHEIAEQLNLPAGARVAGLRTEERVDTVQQRVVVPAEESQDLAAQIDRLRQLVAERDARIREQQEELERIRRTLTAPARQ